MQDATAGILIDDNNGVITSSYSVGDGISGLSGTLTTYGNMLQFVPTADPGAPASSGNTLSPLVVTLEELSRNFDSYEARLVKVKGVSFLNAAGDFATVTSVIGFKESEMQVSEYNATKTVQASLVIEPAAPTDGMLELEISSERVYGEHYVTVPASENGILQLPFTKGATEATFEVQVLKVENQESPLELLFSLRSASGTLVINEEANGFQLTATILTAVNEGRMEEEATIFPNPVKNKASFKNVPVNSQLTIVDMQGKIIYSQQLRGDSVDLTTFSEGLYVLQIRNEYGVTSKKLLIKR